MRKNLYDLSDAQWEVLAVFETLEHPVSLPIVRNLVSLSPEAFLDVIHKAKQAGWLMQTDADDYHLSQDLPVKIRKKLRSFHDPARLSTLLDRIPKSGLKDPVSTNIISALLTRIARKDELALLEWNLAKTDVENGKLQEASKHLEHAVLLLAQLTHQPDLAGIFIASVLDLWKVRMRIGQVTDDTLQRMHQARSVAKTLGDRRSEAIINLNLGCSSFATKNLSESIADLTVGLEEIEEIDDEDFRNQAAEFRGIYYFFQGMFKDAIKYFDYSIQPIEFRDDKILSFFGYYLYGYCAAYLGHFHSSLGFLEYCYRFFSEKAGPREASIFESALGIILIMTGKQKQGLQHLQKSLADSITYNNVQSLFLSQIGLSYYYFQEGQLDESYQSIRRGMGEAVKRGFMFRNYTFPWVLEQYFEFHRRGYDFRGLPYAKHGFHQELQRIIEGPNIHQRGIAHRILALEKADQGNDLDFIQSNLQASERYLRRSGDPIELAKTRLELAKLHMQSGLQKEAAVLAQQAWRKVAKYDFFVFPDVLRPLLKTAAFASGKKNPPERILENFLDIFGEFTPSSNLDEMLTRLVTVLTKFYGAERGGLFWFEDHQKRSASPSLKAAWNLTKKDVLTESFRSTSLKHILGAYQNHQPLIFRPHQGLGKTAATQILAIMCLPFEIKGRVKGILYFDNAYVDNFIESIDKSLLLKISRHLSSYIERLFEYGQSLEQKARFLLNTEARTKSLADGGIVAQSALMTQLLAKADHVAAIDAPVMLLGETGVGKELLARRIHQMSPRSPYPFIVVDISTIPENLIESELFGHEKGAFTGADHQKPGRLELADKGTLFIDEVGEIPRLVQPKLLRVLEDKSFVRIGGITTLKPDYRLIVATNRNLEEEVARGNFRQDLYYRLNVISFKIPPLRERDQDVTLLATHFLNHFEHKYNCKGHAFSPEEEAKLIAYHWPGNVRELKNVIERYILLSADERLESMLPNLSNPFLNDASAETPTMDELQRRYIRFLINKTGGKIGGPGGVAELLGMNRTTLYTRMKKLGLS
ncbi:MAG: sigma-54-dependent Fis family transcriptional regulator [Deltaproteobacteria bacterium]|nr:sigma-54-dependent Fis family transcriptional regulator [Deltaproteobacteria bacterium]